jgi:UDP-3-O-[3-hydroxymyristoyl] N-acetylglucosamine deacetylase
VDMGDAWASLSPGEPFYSASIDFPGTAIGHQSLGVSWQAMARNVADCRTFCRMEDVEAMRSAGLALGGSLENAVVLSGGGVLNPEGFRRRDEAVRHKILDSVGDLYLSGYPIYGRYDAVRPGHALNNTLLQALFADTSAWRLREAEVSRKLAA